jgi:hypothetical protein
MVNGDDQIGGVSSSTVSNVVAPPLPPQPPAPSTATFNPTASFMVATNVSSDKSTEKGNHAKGKTSKAKSSQKQQRGASNVTYCFDPNDNAPFRIYPPLKGSLNSNPLIQALNSIAKQVTVIGILSSESIEGSYGPYAFANRLLGKQVFYPPQSKTPEGDSKIFELTPKKLRSDRPYARMDLYYDEQKNCAFVLGTTHNAGDMFSQEENKGNKDGVHTNFQNERLRFEREKKRMELLMLTSCQMVWILKDTPRFDTNLLPQIRQLIQAKQELLTILSSSTSSQQQQSRDNKSVFTPGKCVPLVIYVTPGPDEILRATARQASSKSRSATVQYCKSLEATLSTLLRSIRGGNLGMIRTRDAFSSTNLSKEKRLFNMDPTHSVVIISRRACTSEASLIDRMAEIVLALEDPLVSFTAPSSASTPSLNYDALLKPLEESDEDTGLAHVSQYLNRFLDGMSNINTSNVNGPTGSGSSSSNRESKDAKVCLDQLSLIQWLKSFQKLLKSLHRLEQSQFEAATSLSNVKEANEEISMEDSTPWRQHVDLDRRDY